MGKTKYNKQPNNYITTRKKNARLASDEELYSERELKELKRKRGIAVKYRDQRLKEEQASWDALGICTACYSKLTTTGVCMSSCA